MTQIQLSPAQRATTRSARSARAARLFYPSIATIMVVLAAIGTYGVMSYVVSQGTRDIGIRVALGATRRNILGMVLRQGTALAATGLAVGLAGAWALTRFMQSLLFGVCGTDRLTFLAVALLLAGVAIVAVLIPASRAARIDPLVALSAE